MYDKATMVEIVQEAQRKCTLTPRLIEVIKFIVNGLYSRQGFCIDLEDFRQNVYVIMLKKLHKIDPTREVFNYLTSIAYNEARQMIRTRTWEMKKLEGYAQIVCNCNVYVSDHTYKPAPPPEPAKPAPTPEPAPLDPISEQIKLLVSEMMKRHCPNA